LKIQTWIFFFLIIYSNCEIPKHFDTYYVDSLGKVEIRKLNGNLSSVSICLPHPVWYSFIEGGYHYIQIGSLISENECRISIYCNNSGIILGQYSSFCITIKNLDSYNPIRITSIITTKTEIIGECFTPFVIEPSSESSINLYIFPTETGLISSLIYIDTSRGIVTFPLSYWVTSAYHESSPQRIFHQSNPMFSNITLRIPPFKTKGILFDQSVFNTLHSKVSDKYLTLSPSKLRPGMYLTMVELLSEPIKQYLPIFLFVSSKLIQPSSPIIIIPVITSDSEFKYKEISIINPSPIQFHIESVSFETIHPNLEFEYYEKTSIVPKLTKTCIGRVVLKGGIQGDINTDLILKYRSLNNKEYRLDIPLRGSVIYGSVFFNVSCLNIEGSLHSISGFTVYNNFSYPITILFVHIENPQFRAYEFIPQIIKPYTTSQPISIKYTSINKQQQDSVIILETNITTFELPVKGYIQDLLVAHKNESSLYSNSILFQLGRVYCGIVDNVSIYLYNPNPDNLRINRFSTSKGIEFFDPIEDLVVSAFSSIRFVVPIHFKHIKSTKLRNDTVLIQCNEQNVTVILQWKPIKGSILIKNETPSFCLIGSNSTLSIYIKNTYPFAIRVSNVTSIENKILCSLNEKKLKPSTYTKLFHISFMVESESLPNCSFLSHVNNKNPYSVHKKIWDEYWKSNNFIIAKFRLYLKSGGFFLMSVSINLAFAVLPDLHINVGDMLPYIEHQTVISINNPFQSYISFIYRQPDFRAKPYHHTVIGEPQKIALLPLVFYPKRIGRFRYTIPIISNSTPPFTIYASANIIYPNITVLDIHDMHIEFIEFNSSLNNLSFTLILRNLTPLNLVISYYLNKTFPYIIDSKCSVISSLSDCSFVFRHIPLPLTNNNKNCTFIFQVHGVIYKIPIFFNNNLNKMIHLNLLEKSLFAMMASYLVPFVFLVLRFIQNILFQAKIAKKLTKTSSEIHRLTSSNYVSKETQYGAESICTWVKTNGNFYPYDDYSGFKDVFSSHTVFRNIVRI